LLKIPHFPPIFFFQNSKNSPWKESLIKRILCICVQILVVFWAQRVITSVSMVHRGAHGYQPVLGRYQGRVDTHPGVPVDYQVWTPTVITFMWKSRPFRSKG
jgi:hypothetical protein